MQLNISEANQELCKAIGIEPGKVESISITADASGWSITVKLIPQPILVNLVCKTIKGERTDG
jgi:hypothetical protein